MNKITFVFILSLFYFPIYAQEKAPWSKEYQDVLMEKIGKEIKNLSEYPSTLYPSEDLEPILNKFPDGKIPIFGYGSLMNAESAGRSVGPEAVQSMEPVAAFGLKRIFNYKVSEVAPRWGSDLPENEKAMLNVEPTTTTSHIINGVVMTVSHQELHKLVEREKGYDLVPVLIADWNDLVAENPEVKIKVAYTFYVPDELRGGIDYTQTKYYPVRGYLQAVRTGAAVYGEQFLNYWDETTYLGDGTTTIQNWDEKTFSGILDTQEP